MAKLDPYKDPNKTQDGPFSQESTAEVFKAPTDGGVGPAYTKDANSVDPPRKLNLSSQQREPYQAPSEFKAGVNLYFPTHKNPSFLRNSWHAEVPDPPKGISAVYEQGGPTSVALSLLQTGYINQFTRWKNSISDAKTHSSHTIGMTNADDMPYGTRYGNYLSSLFLRPAFIFNTDGLGPGTISSATLTLTPIDIGSDSQRPDYLAINAGMNHFQDFNLGTLSDEDYLDGAGGPFTNSGSYRPTALTINATNLANHNFEQDNYDFDAYCVPYDLTSHTWEANTPISFDVTAILNGYFASPTRSTNTEICFKLGMATQNDVGYGYTPSYSSNSSDYPVFGGKTGSYAPTLTVLHTPLTRTNLTVATGNIGSVASGGQTISERAANGGSSSSTTDVAVSRYISGEYISNHHTQGFLYFPISDELEQGTAITKAYLLGANYYDPADADDDRRIYGDNSGTSAKVTDYSNFDTKTLTTAFKYVAPGGAYHSLYNATKVRNQTSVIDVTDIVNEIIANGSWDGNAVQLLIPDASGTYTSVQINRYVNPVTGLTDYPILSILK
jgi:hypothetical protein